MEGNKAHNVLTRLVVTVELQTGLDAAMDALVRVDGARAAALIERSGLLLSGAGQGPVTEPALAALVAGVFKSLTALSELMGEGEVSTFQQVGPSSYTVFNLLDSGDALVASFPPQKPQRDVGGALNLAIAKISPLLKKARSGGPSPGLKLDADSIDSVLGNL